MISASALTVKRGIRTVLHNVEVSVAPGAVWAVLGPNGAGKSTLLAALAGDVAPETGRVEIAGRDPRRWEADALARTRGVLTQSPAIASPFSVRETVALGRLPWRSVALRKENEAAVERAMAETGVDCFADRTVTRLSGGEAQRVHLARVLAQLNLPADSEAASVPRALLLDEPTDGLDPLYQHLVMRSARSAALQGAAVVAVLHDLSLAARYADHVLLLVNGVAVACGSVEEVMTAAVIERAYGIHVTVDRDPVTGRPHILVHGLPGDSSPRHLPDLIKQL